MASFNKVILLGNLTRDPELRYTPKGTAVARLGLAVNRRYTGENNQTVEEVTFIDVDAWGKSAELIAQYLRKGNPIFIEGRLKLDQWDDKTSGQKVSKLRVVLESFQFVGGKAGEGGPTGAPSAPTPRPQRPAAPTPPPPSAPAAGGGSDFDGPPPDDDDVPF
jgi:single-strand DNA-binding protein